MSQAKRLKIVEGCVHDYETLAIGPDDIMATCIKCNHWFLMRRPDKPDNPKPPNDT